MLAAFDVQYGATRAGCACVQFDNWSDETPRLVETMTRDEVSEYVSGEFWRRELPPILELLGRLSEKPELIIVDGYVFLDGQRRPGLGKHLYDALNGETPVVGVAKRAFQGSPHAEHVFRGESRQALFVTSIGVATTEAAERVRQMAGNHRMPLLLKAVDRAARDALAAPST